MFIITFLVVAEGNGYRFGLEHRVVSSLQATCSTYYWSGYQGKKSGKQTYFYNPLLSDFRKKANHDFKPIYRTDLNDFGYSEQCALEAAFIYGTML